MSFFDEDAWDGMVEDQKSRAKSGELRPPKLAPDQQKAAATLIGEIVGMLVGIWLYQRMGAPKWAAVALVGIETRLSRIVRAVS